MHDNPERRVFRHRYGRYCVRHPKTGLSGPHNIPDIRATLGRDGQQPSQLSTGKDLTNPRQSCWNYIKYLIYITILNYLLPSEGRGQGFESLRVRHFSVFSQLALQG
jgi:hypothetical protein